MDDLRRSRTSPWMHRYKWPIYFFVSVAFWNMVGAGLFGFMINPPVALYYMQGLNTTPLHGHAALFGVYGMLGIGLMRGQSWLAFIMKDMIPMEQEGWMILTRRLCLVFLLLAIANEFVWRTMSEEAWVTIETFAFPVALMAFLFLQMMALQPYIIEEETEADSES